MPALVEVLVKTWVNELAEEDRLRMEVLANQVFEGVKKFQKVAEVLGGMATQYIRQAEVEHDRAVLLTLYRLRHKWRKADVPRLKTYELNTPAKRRMAALAASKRLGPGCTIHYQSLGKKLAEAGQYFSKLSNPGTPARERRRLLKEHRGWWAQFIEMTYRGEYARLKKMAMSAPSEEAEHAVAKAFCISQSSVRRECIAVRRQKMSDELLPLSLTVAEFELWLDSGLLPDNGNK